MAFNALVLAGSRPGPPEPVAAYAGVAHKALIVLEGQTLLARVTTALRAAGAARICAITGDGAVRAEAGRLGIEVLPQAAGPSLSVKAGAEALGTPLVVTTADSALLQADWVTAFLADTPADADIAAMVASRAAVEAAAPGAQRTWLKLADGDWKGCNLFLLRTERALAAVELWRRVEAERKRPWRMAAILGPGMLLRYAVGRLGLKDGAERLGRMAGIKAAVVEALSGLATIDVDKPADLDLVRHLTAEPGSQRSSIQT